MHSDVYSHISHNNWKILGLILLFPISLCAFLYAIFAIILAFTNNSSFTELNSIFIEIVPIVIAVCTIITIISFLFGSNMMLGFAEATEINTQIPSNLEIKRMVENVALAAGIPTPKVYLINDDSLNAFATGYSPKNASIALTTGIVKKLKPLELQSVIAHEIGHIINRDIRLNMYIITGIGSIVLLGELLVRSCSHLSNTRNNNDNKGSIAVFLMITGFALILFRYIIAPFIHMAISRTQEYQADATSAFLTRNPLSLASALEKISIDPRVEILDKSTQMAAVCIYNPLDKAALLLDTHPSVKDRIKRLKSMI